jgi:hypothetical protein
MSKVARVKFREHIRQAQLTVKNPNSAPEITQSILKHKFDDETEAMLRAVGAAQWVRSDLKAFTESPRRDQIELWPTHLQTLALDIDRARVYVPSSRTYKELTPANITPTQCREAGNYLIEKGEECIIRGRFLVKLSNKSW